MLFPIPLKPFTRLSTIPKKDLTMSFIKGAAAFNMASNILAKAKLILNRLPTICITISAIIIAIPTPLAIPISFPIFLPRLSAALPIILKAARPATPIPLYSTVRDIVITLPALVIRLKVPPADASVIFMCLPKLLTLFISWPANIPVTTLP